MPRSSLNLHGCVAAFESYRGPLQLCQALQPVCDAYHRNITRVTSLAMFLPAIATVAAHSAAIAQQLRSQMQGSPDSEYRSAVEAALRQHAELRQHVFSKEDAEARAIAAEEVEIGFSIASDIDGFGYDASQAWLAALVTGIWTAFEAVAEGLWEASLNAHPRGLAELRGKRNTSEDDRRILLTLLQKYEYDLSTHMGTLLKVRYNFDRLDSMRDAYLDAFPTSATEVHQVVTSTALDTLALVRNLIVHSGGIIDAAYLRRKSHLPERLLGEAGSAIELDGKIVAELVRPAIEAGQTLLQAVDRWILSN